MTKAKNEQHEAKEGRKEVKEVTEIVAEGKCYQNQKVSISVLHQRGWETSDSFVYLLPG